MRAKVYSTLLLIFALLVSSVTVSAQQLMTSSDRGGSAKTATIEELREDIRGLETAASKPSASNAEREISSAVLQERRVRLYGLLRKRVSALRAYHGTVTSEPERVALEKDIQKRLAELRVLEQDIYKNSTGNLYTGSAPAVAAARPLPSSNAAASPAQQQPKGRTWVQIQIDEAVKEIVGARDDTEKALRANLLTSKPKLVVYSLARDPAVREALDNAEEARIDKEVGGGDENAGGTSLVAKGATPAILGFAVHNGALTQENDGMKITFRGNLVGIVEALRNQGYLESYRDDSPGTKHLRKFSFGFTFDTSRGDQPGTFLANRQQLSSYTFRYEFINDRDPRDPKYVARWQALADADFQDALNELSGIALEDDVVTRWSDEGEDSIKAIISAGGSREQVDQEVRRRLALLPDLYNTLTPATQDRVNIFVKKYEAFLKSRKNLLKVISKGPLLTFEFKGDRRPGLIDTSNLKVIGEGDVLSHFGVPEGWTELTYNGSMTFFNSSPGAGMRRLRDFDHALQLDVPFIVRDMGSFVFSFAGKYKRISDDETAANGAGSAVMVATKGDILLLQGKLQIPLKGFKIPLSLSYANRTELIKEREVRGNIGFTFDFDPFYALLRK